MLFIDTWYDLWRFGNLIVGILCFIWLIGGLIKQHQDWNVKTRDFWYSRLVWSIAQISLSTEGIIKGFSISYSLVLITAAGLVTLKGLLHKGSWGYVEE